MAEAGRCASCRWWAIVWEDEEDEPDNGVSPQIGRCGLHTYRAGLEDHMGGGGYRGSSLFLEMDSASGEEWDIEVTTPPDFGCVQHEAGIPPAVNAALCRLCGMPELPDAPLTLRCPDGHQWEARSDA